MLDAKHEKGSFTIEATFICSLILIISANIIIEALWIYDKCILNEEINRYMLQVEDMLEDDYRKGGIYGENRCINKNVSMENNIKKNMQNRTMISDIDDVDCRMDDRGISIRIKYRRINSVWGIRRYLGLEYNKNEIRRYMSLGICVIE